MRPLAAGLCLTLFVAVVAADDHLPREEARRYARVCVEQLGSLEDAPVQTAVDPDKAVAVRGEGGGAMAVPDKKLTRDRVARAGRDVVPVGQVWLRKWGPVVRGKAVPDDRLRIVTVNVDDKDRPMPLLLLGVRKGARGPELLVYSAGAEPLLTLPLEKVEFVQELPLELEWQRGEKNVDPLTLTLFGRYRATLPITRRGK